MPRVKKKTKTEKVKKERAGNYTMDDKRLLVRWPLKHSHILESKVTNSKTVLLDKNDSWINIRETFNSSVDSGVSIFILIR